LTRARLTSPCSSGLTQTEEFDLGFPSGSLCANLSHASGNFHHSYDFGPPTLEVIISDRNAAQKHVWRAGIILLPSVRLGLLAIMASAGKSKTTVWRWQERFAEAGVDGLLSDKTRPPAKARISAGKTSNAAKDGFELSPDLCTRRPLRKKPQLRKMSERR
jgi:hypothetical protein